MGDASRAASGPLGVTRTLHITDPSDTLKEELEHFPEIAVSFKLGLFMGGCPNKNFYHLIMNAALPLYAKAVRPFAQERAIPPRRTVYVNSWGGGVIELLREIFPEFEFVFVPWVPQCCAGLCRPQQPNLYERHVPLFVLHSDGITGRYLHHPAYLFHKKEYRQLVWDFRKHILERAPGGQHPSKHVYVSRRGESHRHDRGLDAAVEQQLIQAMNATAAGVQVSHLEGMSFWSQVKIHQEASVVVGVHGAAFVHCLWMPRNSRIIEIRPETWGNAERPYFKLLCNDILELDWRFYQAAGPDGNLRVSISDFMSEYEDLLR